MSRKVIQCTTLGNNGRFGNQLWQYCFAKALATRNGAELQIPEDWVGRKIFNIVDEPIKQWLPQTSLDQVSINDVNVDLFGYFQDPAFHTILNDKDIRSWLTFQPKWLSLYDHFKQAPYTALHMRKGDYKNLQHVFCLVSDESYYKASEENGHFDLNLQIMTEENPTPCQHAKEIGAGFLPDFFKLMYATHLYRSNSTFSWWAGYLGNNDVYSPVVGNLVGLQTVPFVKGNHPKIFAGHSGDIYIKGYNS
jgi:hypothetical protein